MRPDRDVFRFGPFELDSARRRLMRGRERVPLRDSHLDLLLLLVQCAGQIVSKDVLAEAGWKGTAVDDNNVAQAVSRLRKTLGAQKDGKPFIENVIGRGYRFAGPVERGDPGRPHLAVDALVAPHRVFVDGRAALETLGRDDVARACPAFEEALGLAPEHPAAHLGLANACFLQFESTRVDVAPDVAALERATHHAREACRLDPASGEAWSTLALVLSCHGDAPAAIAAARAAIALEPYDWCHHLRLAFVSWGGQRLRAAKRVAHMYPGLALAHWFTGTVLIGRQLYDEAVEELRIGCVAHDAQRTQTGRFNAVGLHLLLGLLLAARGAHDQALEEFSRELADLNARHVYARECGANTWYAIGALGLRQGCRDEAAAAFREALTRVPGHPLASVGLASISPSSAPFTSRPPANPVHVASVQAAVLALRGKHDDAAGLCGAALCHAAPGSAGWLLPLDPLIHATAHPGAWAHTLGILRHRAA